MENEKTLKRFALGCLVGAIKADLENRRGHSGLYTDEERIEIHNTYMEYIKKINHEIDGLDS